MKFGGCTVSHRWIAIVPFQLMAHCTDQGNNMNAQIPVFILVCLVLISFLQFSWQNYVTNVNIQILIERSIEK